MTRTCIQKYSCDRCAMDFVKDKLRRQRGMLLCPDCADDLTKIPTPNTQWRSPRLPVSGQELVAVTTPIVYTITATGVTALQQSQTFRRDGWKHYYVMHIVGSAGGVQVAADPQIVAGTDGDRLTLRGTSTTSAVKFIDGSGLTLMTSFITLGEDDILNLVYDDDTGWVETSRDKVDFDAQVFVAGSWDYPGSAWDDAAVAWDQS